MSWQAAMLHEQHMDQIKTDHGLAEARMESFRRPVRLSTSMWSQGYRKGWWDAIAWILHAQGEYDSLTVGEAVTELGKEQASIYWPIKQDDPRVWGDCDGCGQPRLFDKRGICDDCGWEVS